MAQTATRELTDENIFQILAQGALVFMEDDLRQLQGGQAQVFREKKKRSWLKIAPRQKKEVAGLSVKQEKKESFFSKIKSGLGLSQKQKQSLLEKASTISPSLSTMPLPPIAITPNEPAPVVVAPVSAPAFSVATAEPKPIITRKDLASGLRLGERAIDLPTEPVFTPVVVPLSVVPATMPTPPLTAIVLPENFKVEPLFIEELQEKAEQRNRFAQEKSDLDARLQVFWPQRRPLELKLATLAEEKQALVKSLSPFIIKDAQIKSQEKEIEQKEKATSLPQERHQLEEQRWALEQQRRQAAQQKWAQEEKVETKNAEIKAVELQLQNVLTQEGNLLGQKEKATEELEKISFAQERLMLIEKVAVLDAQRRGLAKEKAASQSEDLLLSRQLNELGQQEKALEAQEVSLEEVIDKADSFPKKKEIEQNRWRLDEQRKSTEQKRWETEKRAEQNKEQTDILFKSYDETLQKQIALELRAEDIDIYLRKPFTEAESIVNERNKQKETVEAAKKQEIETRSEQVKPLLPILNFLEKPAIESKPKVAPIKPAIANKPEILSGSEAQTAVKIKQQTIIREREKNLALIQQKAETQRESFVAPKIKGPLSKADILLRLSQVSPEELAGREKFMARLAGHAPSLMGSMKNGKEIVFRPLVKKSSLFEKVLARIFFLLIIFVVVVIAVVLVYFYVILPKPEPSLPIAPQETPVVVSPTTTPTSTPIFIEQPAPLEAPSLTGPATTTVTTTPIAPIATTTAPTTTPVAVSPLPLIAVQQTKVLQLALTTSIADLLKTALQENQWPGLTEIVFQTDVGPLSLNGFLAIFLSNFTVWPENIANALAPGDTLLLSGEGATSRFGFVVNVKDPVALAVNLRAWEPQMEKDWAELWTALGKNNPAVARYFRAATYNGVAFRYQTFTKQDFGICYAIFNDKFILTTSYAQMKLIIDELKKVVAP